MRRTLVTAVIAAGLVSPASAEAATRLVDNDKVQCPTAQFTTIQAGVDAAQPGDTVLVCSGVYREAVTISGPAKDGVRLVAKVTLDATIKAPDDFTGGIVTINDADNVVVSRFRIVGPFTGPGGFGCPPGGFGAGVAVYAGSNGKVLGNFINQIQDQAGGTCTALITAYGVVSQSAGLVVDQNRIGNYLNVGVLYDSPSASGLISRNMIIASAANQNLTFPRQAGVALQNGARADVNTNNISKNLGPTTTTTDSWGILLLSAAASGVILNGNRLFENDRGIQISETRNALVKSNVIFDNNDHGILVQAGSGNTVTRNDARRNGGTDCQDDTTGGPAGSPNFTTLNKWTFNRGHEAVPPGICTR